MVVASIKGENKKNGWWLLLETTFFQSLISRVKMDLFCVRDVFRTTSNIYDETYCGILKNGKTNEITNWSKLCERYDSNKLEIITQPEWIHILYFNLACINPSDGFQMDFSFSHQRLKAKDIQFKFVISFSKIVLWWLSESTRYRYFQ